MFYGKVEQPIKAEEVVLVAKDKNQDNPKLNQSPMMI